MEATSSQNFPPQHRFQRIHTSCKQCVFRRDKNDSTLQSLETNLVSQEGCQLGMIDKFEAVKPGSVVPVYDESGNEFFVIDGRHCPYCRGPQWAELYKDHNLIDLVKAQAQVKIHYIIYADKDTNPADLIKTLASLNSQHIPPAQIIILNQTGALLIEAQDYLNNEANLKWKIEHILDDRTMDEWVDTYVNKTAKNENWFSVCKPGYEYNDRYSLEFNKRILDNLEIVLAIMPDQDGNGGLFNKFVFQGSVGNKGFNFFEKMESLEQNKYFVKVNELCDQM